MNRSALFSFIGIILIILGFLSLILKIVGVHLSFLFWLENLGYLPATLIRLAMVFGGILMIYLSRTESNV